MQAWQTLAPAQATLTIITHPLSWQLSINTRALSNPITQSTSLLCSATPPAAKQPLPDGRQPYINVWKQIINPSEYYEDVLQGRDFAAGQFATSKDAAFIGSSEVARELLGSEERSGLNIGWPSVLGARVTIGETHSCTRTCVGAHTHAHRQNDMHHPSNP